MRCFVAMAFSRPDTDVMYEGSIHGALLARGIEPVRMDRIEHNENVDDRILTEIRTSDFAIVDLTYARPSVYYEAGFAEREIPVIYTIRRDHLSPRPDDEFGVFRLHFDLAMRNVIDWIPGDDDVFRSRLGSRIDTVVRPLLEAARDRQAEAARRESFQALSIRDRERSVIEAADAFFTASGFRKAGEVEGLVYRTWPAMEHTYFQAAGGVCRFMTVELSYSPEQSLLGPTLWNEYDLNVHGGVNRISRVERHWIFCAFHAVPFEDACRANSHFRPIPQRRTLVEEHAQELPALPAAFRGEVVLGSRPVTSSTLRKLWDGGDPARGFLTRTPPGGMVHVPGENGYQFVHSGFSWRQVAWATYLHVFDGLVSLDDLGERLRQVVFEPVS